MGQIQVLSPTLVNRIAAGECIERPASVVKELVENALDAGARAVNVTLTDGGRALVQVADDGTGMDADDLRLCVEAHATSKIRGDDDLFQIRTMGFRGEALPSIASIARLQITSRRHDADVGHTLTVDGDELRGPTPCAAPPGTTVAVRDLFHAVPARRKFLRTNTTEVGHVTEQLARLALPQPGVAFTLQHQSRVSHKLGATTDRRQRIADFFGPELAEGLLPIGREGTGIAVEGLVAPPAQSRGSGKWEYVFVNGRFVRDRFVSHAVKEAYRSLIDPARFPVVFLFIAIEPGDVDVNVHPTKVEVRWRDSNYVHGQVLAALREKFLSTNLDHHWHAPSENDEYRTRVRTAMVDFFRHAPGGTPGGRPATAGAPPAARATSSDATSSRPSWPPVPGADARAPRDNAGSATGSTFLAGGLSAGELPLAESPASTLPRDESQAAHAATPERQAGAVGGHADAAGRVGELPLEGDAGTPPRFVQIHNTYLVVETVEGVMIIDQHALHERILYEELRRRLAERRLESQRLLLPEVVRVPPDRLEVLETHAETLARLGIELAPAGPQSVALHAFPSLLLDRVNPTRFVGDLLDRLAEQGTRPCADTLVHELLDMLACKAAVKAGDPLTPGEIAALLERRALAERSSHCPHGRPTTLHLSLRDLERQFLRR